MRRKALRVNVTYQKTKMEFGGIFLFLLKYLKQIHNSLVHGLLPSSLLEDSTIGFKPAILLVKVTLPLKCVLATFEATSCVSCTDLPLMYTAQDRDGHNRKKNDSVMSDFGHLRISVPIM